MLCMPADQTAEDLGCEGEHASLADSRLQGTLDRLQKLRLRTVIKVTAGINAKTLQFAEPC